MSTNKRRTLLILTALVLLAGAITFAGRLAMAGPEEEPADQAQAEPRPIALEPVARLGADSIRTYPGSARAVQAANLAFRVAGPLVQVAVQPGSMVNRGDMLLQIDPRDFQDNVNVLRAQLSGARAGRDIARLTLDRTTPLLAQQVVSQADYDKAKSAFDTAQATVASLEAQLDIATHRLEDTTLAAPFAGMVTMVAVDNYEMVAAGQTVVKMHDVSSLEIDVDVPENEIADLDLASGAVVANASFPSLAARSSETASFPLALKEWTGEADPGTRTYTVTFVMDVPEGLTVLPGMTSTVAVTLPRSAASPLVVPAGAVSANADGDSIVWVYDRKTATASPRIIRTGELADGHYATVEHGLEEGELVVTAGLDFITEGMALKPLNPDSL